MEKTYVEITKNIFLKLCHFKGVKITPEEKKLKKVILVSDIHTFRVAEITSIITERVTDKSWLS